MNEAAIMDDGGADAGQEGIGSTGGLGLRKDYDNDEDVDGDGDDDDDDDDGVVVVSRT